MIIYLDKLKQKLENQLQGSEQPININKYNLIELLIVLENYIFYLKQKAKQDSEIGEFKTNISPDPELRKRYRKDNNIEPINKNNKLDVLIENNEIKSDESKMKQSYKWFMNFSNPISYKPELWETDDGGE